MPDDPVYAYQTALHNLKTATERSNRLFQTIRDGANKLQNWKHILVHEAGTSLLPDVARYPNTPLVDLQNWPTAQDIGQALSAWHQAKASVEGAWRDVPPERRIGLQEPATFY